MKSLIFQENIHWRDFYGLTKSLSVDPKVDCYHHAISASEIKDVLVYQSSQPLLLVAMSLHTYDMTYTGMPHPIF